MATQSRGVRMTSDNGAGMMWGNVEAHDPHRARREIMSALMRQGVDFASVGIISIARAWGWREGAYPPTSSAMRCLLIRCPDAP